jgi:RNA polymerase sigma-70 factor (TIGR02960 family)
MTDDFPVLLERHRREIHVHCYRMLGSFDEAEDAVQDAFLRAWDARERFGGELNFRAWLYRIATNVCLDAIRRRRRRAPSLDRSFSEISWLQPYPDRLLDEVAPPEDEPDAVVVARETIELAFLALIQLLPARQRAVLLMRDVLEFSAAETATLLEMSTPAVNSALQRARATMAQRPARERPTGQISAYEHELLAKFIEAHERGDHDASLAIAREDIRITMPPHPLFFEGRAAMAELCERAFGSRDGTGGMGQWRLVATAANRMPTAASYLLAPGDTVFRAFKFDVLRIEGDWIAETTTFMPDLFGAFGLPMTLPA